MGDLSTIELLKSDLARLCMPTFGNFLKFYFSLSGGYYRYTFWLRVTSQLKKKDKKLLAAVSYLRLKHYEIKYGIHVSTNIVIGRGFHIVHGGGIFLNCREIGDNFTVYQNVTLGSLHNDYDIPIIRNSVTIYTGAVVCGNITIEDNCVIGANSYVDKDMSPASIAIGPHGRIVENKDE